ncbi:MAG: cation:proton antiporter [Planctomycetota bacterium]
MTAPRTRITIFYALTLIATYAAFRGIEYLGSNQVDLSIPADSNSSSRPADARGTEILPRLIAVLTAIIILSRAIGRVFRYVRQPRVIGEIVAGLVLGPSLFGALAPELYQLALPPAVLPSLNALAQIGIVLFMFLVGLELDPRLLRSQTHVAVSVSHASIIAPFLLGSASALYLYSTYAPPGVSFSHFALFFGVSMSVTAFPVLARILIEKGIQKTPLGSIALTCAALNDVTAWCLLAYLVGVVNSTAGSYLTIVYAIAYALFMIFVVRAPLQRFLRRFTSGDLQQGYFALIIVGILTSACITELIGIHALFGAFLFGALIPSDVPLAHELRARIEDLVLVLFLPIFFAYTGLRTDIFLISDWESILICAGIIAIATIGKFGGSFIAARIAGLGSRDSAVIGILMNTRGLMELIVLNVGLDLGLITPKLFAMMVIMALVTTFMTSPLVDLFYKPEAKKEN